MSFVRGVRLEPRVVKKAVPKVTVFSGIVRCSLCGQNDPYNGLVRRDQKLYCKKCDHERRS